MYTDGKLKMMKKQSSKTQKLVFDSAQTPIISIQQLNQKEAPTHAPKNIKKYCFKLETDKKRYYFGADTAKNQQKWITCFEAVGDRGKAISPNLQVNVENYDTKTSVFSDEATNTPEDEMRQELKLLEEEEQHAEVAQMKKEDIDEDIDSDVKPIEAVPRNRTDQFVLKHECDKNEIGLKMLVIETIISTLFNAISKQKEFSDLIPIAEQQTTILKKILKKNQTYEKIIQCNERINKMVELSQTKHIKKNEMILKLLEALEHNLVNPNPISILIHPKDAYVPSMVLTTSDRYLSILYTTQTHMTLSFQSKKDAVPPFFQACFSSYDDFEWNSFLMSSNSYYKFNKDDFETQMGGHIQIADFLQRLEALESKQTNHLTDTQKHIDTFETKIEEVVTKQESSTKEIYVYIDKQMEAYNKQTGEQLKKDIDHLKMTLNESTDFEEQTNARFQALNHRMDSLQKTQNEFMPSLTPQIDDLKQQVLSLKESSSSVDEKIERVNTTFQEKLKETKETFQGSVDDIKNLIVQSTSYEALSKTLQSSIDQSITKATSTLSSSILEQLENRLSTTQNTLETSILENATLMKDQFAEKQDTINALTTKLEQLEQHQQADTESLLQDIQQKIEEIQSNHQSHLKELDDALVDKYNVYHEQVRDYQVKKRFLEIFDEDTTEHRRQHLLDIANREGLPRTPSSYTVPSKSPASRTPTKIPKDRPSIDRFSTGIQTSPFKSIDNQLFSKLPEPSTPKTAKYLFASTTPYDSFIKQRESPSTSDLKLDPSPLRKNSNEYLSSLYSGYQSTPKKSSLLFQ